MKMRKWYSILFLGLALLLASSVIACQPSPSSAPPTSDAIPPSSLPPISTLSPSPTLNVLAVHFIDVGQGDSILIDQGETEVLIDGGEASPGVTDYLKKYVDGPLEVVVATHPHADHIGGLASVLRTFKVLDVWTNGETSTSATYSTFTAAVQTSGASVHTGRRGEEITTGELSFSVLNPVTLTDTTNNNSIVLSLDYGKTSFLFEGDAEKEAEASMLGAGVVPHAEILKVGHHGSKTASSQPFLATVQPEVAVYMAGVGNQYGHPHQETLNALFQIGAKVYGTDVNGNISITTDGKAYTVRLENQALPPPPPPAQTEPSPLPTGKYVGSINSNVYHYPSCRYVEQIHPENLVWFASAAEAQAKGYRPCKVCNPPSATPQPSNPTVTTCSGATAICNDGTCSYSQHRSGTCSHHGGVRQWK